MVQCSSWTIFCKRLCYLRQLTNIYNHTIWRVLSSKSRNCLICSLLLRNTAIRDNTPIILRWGYDNAVKSMVFYVGISPAQNAQLVRLEIYVQMQNTEVSDFTVQIRLCSGCETKWIPPTADVPCISEPVFGQRKECINHNSFRLRGMAKVQGEFTLMAIGHNLKKMHRLLLRKGSECQVSIKERFLVPVARIISLFVLKRTVRFAFP